MQLHPYFRDHMVIPAGKPWRIYGEAEGEVRVTFRGLEVCASAVDGKFCITVPGTGAGGPFEVVITCGESCVTLRDVWSGAVLLIGGQSNMGLNVGESFPPSGGTPDREDLRIYCPVWFGTEGLLSRDKGWVVCTAENTPAWTAVGYHTGVEVARRTGLHVGIVPCYQGAACVESFLPEEIAAKPEYQLEDTWTHGDHRFPEYTWNKPGLLYHSRFLTLGPCGLSAMVWYQGESNTGKGESEVFFAMTCELIRKWREDLLDPELPYVEVQLADCVPRSAKTGWHAVQHVQERVPETVPGGTWVKSRDVCETDRIHPRDKEMLSRRIAAAMLDELKIFG